MEHQRGIFTAGVLCWHWSSRIRSVLAWFLVIIPSVGCVPFTFNGTPMVLSMESEDSVRWHGDAILASILWMTCLACGSSLLLCSELVLSGVMRRELAFDCSGVINLIRPVFDRLVLSVPFVLYFQILLYHVYSE